jgi:hypothetical protein
MNITPSMPDEVDQLKPSSPPATFTHRGGCLGAVVVFILSVIMIAVAFLPSMYRERVGWDSLRTAETIYVLKIAVLLSFVAAVLGYFVGHEGARSPTVNTAFVRGGILCGLATAICLLVLFLTSFRTESVYASGFYILRAIFFMILTASGALVAGLAAIVVRDRRESGKTRFIPQFTLQEIFIVFTIASIIISAMASTVALRL